MVYGLGFKGKSSVIKAVRNGCAWVEVFTVLKFIPLRGLTLSLESAKVKAVVGLQRRFQKSKV